MDKYRGINRLPLVESRIGHLFSRIAINLAAGRYSTREQLVRAYADASQHLSQGHDKQIYDLPKVVAGAPLNEQALNKVLVGVYNELLYLFHAALGTEEVIESNFNYAAGWIRRLQAGVKYCQQQLAAVSLYATRFGDTLYHGETFCSEETIDRGSSFLAEEECFIDLAEGTVSLPRLEEESQREIDRLEIGALSNGVLGNNIEAKVPVRGNLSSATDGNADTWFEFERVVSAEDTEGLRLELKVALKDVQPVNGIVINPVFLGARTPFTIRAIDVSEDGRQWISLKDDVRVAEFLDESEEERFHLSPHSSRFAGFFSITFAPRYVKFLRILIRQSSTFPIIDVYGAARLRYAIGIRELAVHGYSYAAAGELISKPISFDREVALVGLETLVDPPLLPPEVGGAELFLSFDDGASWSQITPLDEASTTVPETLTPDTTTSSLRYKIRLQKDESVFAKVAAGAKTLSFREVHSWASVRPFDIRLLRTPVDGTLSVCDPEAAVRGWRYPKISLGTGVNSDLRTHTDGSSYRRHGAAQHRLRLPLRTIKDPSSLLVYVNNSQWTIVKAVSEFSDEWARECVVQRDTEGDYWEIVFGNDSATSPAGAIPGPSDEVSLLLSPEEISLTGLVAPYRAKLDYPSDGEKRNTQIRFLGNVYKAPTETVTAGVSEFQLAHKNVFLGSWRGDTYKLFIIVRGSGGLTTTTSTDDGSPPSTGSFQNYVPFVDGSTEIPDAGDWTVDTKSGTLYTRTPTPDDEEVTVFYHYSDQKDLSLSDWDFVDGKLDEIQIYESGYYAKEDSATLTASAKVIDLTVGSEDIVGIIPKSVRLSDAALGTYEPFEVPFIDGIREFLGRARIQDEDVPAITGWDTIPVGGGSTAVIARFRLTHYENLVTTAGISFSDISTFAEEQATYESLSSEGDYYFDASGTEAGGAGYVYVVLHVEVGSPDATDYSIPSGVTISYQYYDPSSREQMKGAYSVNALKGKVHFSEPVSTGEVYFRHAPYQIKYNISEELREEKDYEYDDTENTIRVFSGASGASEKKLAISYKYEQEIARTAGLAAYFSPLLRALAVRIA